MLKKLFFLVHFFFSINCLGIESNKIKINYQEISNNRFRVIISLDYPTTFDIQFLQNQKTIALDLSNTNFKSHFIINGNLNQDHIEEVKKIKIFENGLRLLFQLNKNSSLINHSYSRSANSLELYLDFLNPSLKPKKLSRKFIIAIDPGHGGKDFGTTGKFLRILEKNLTLAYAKELAKELKKYPHYLPILLREKDSFLTKEQRRLKTKKLKADILISLHADFNLNPSLQGASIYTLSEEALLREKKLINEQKNKNNILKNNQILNENKEIANILVDMVYNDTFNSSICLANKTKKSFYESQIKTLPKSHRFSDFRVLKGVDIPAILVEIGYLSNKEEENLLSKSFYRKKIVNALSKGINNYFSNNSCS